MRPIDGIDQLTISPLRSERDRRIPRPGTLGPLSDAITDLRQEEPTSRMKIAFLSNLDQEVLRT
jgi:hypothetical protein